MINIFVLLTLLQCEELKHAIRKLHARVIFSLFAFIEIMLQITILFSPPLMFISHNKVLLDSFNFVCRKHAILNDAFVAKISNEFWFFKIRILNVKSASKHCYYFHYILFVMLCSWYSNIFMENKGNIDF